MEPELTLLAQSAGTTVVALMATDAWHRVRDGITQLWHRTQPERAEIVAAELEAGREDVLAAAAAEDEETLDALRLQWQGLVLRLLVARPGAVEELRALLDQLDPGDPAARHITQHATASGQGRVYQAGRDQHIAER
ncbi:hypothetical protein PV755_31905 [Streptomyces caniscabiei]|uniref:Uncharacterized protein n=1 Tax=Streptomyces caniscabiei TaxID=2746961 RepID=A0A927L9C5_9ACTN|nr:hypothetical protein [Streptomyces caniscabiei]MBD9727870.1 hypothetical protein [Streptomyces caniscabiei]MDX3513454.1 hypothetical protein [Streptomyces caniscabiei]MDX3722411.1 hypothetical protein [Streptomyces caniscabiei]WEO27430.1 hypothetical protein IHE65_32125 [Streptomyces caniscabiei]